MAKRTISTRLTIEGEAQYKQAIKAIDAELRNHKSALDLVNSQYKGNANSMDALQSKQKALADIQATQTSKVNELAAVYKNSQAAVEVYSEKKEELTQKIEANEAALEKLKNAEGDTTEEQKKLTEETERLKQELEQTEANLAKAEIKTNNYGNAHNKAQKELNETNDAIKKNDQYLEEAKNSTDKAATSIDEFGKETKTAKESVDALGSALAAAGIVAALKQMADAMTACVQASIEFESAMTGVEKTTDLTDQELAQMADAFKDLSGVIPMTAAELAAIAENAGQLGIEKDNIVGFTNVMADLGVATNLSGEQAAQAIAKIANITGMAQTDFDRFGSAVVALGNNFATTESDIVMMANRLASAGTLAGLTEAEILALATAMSSVGIEAEAGGTAMTQTFSEIEKAVVKGGDKLEQFASVAGISSDAFAEKWKSAPVEAIQLFIGGLGNLESRGESATLVLDEMGLSGIRQSNMLKSLALASDNLSGAVSLSNKAWTENTALTKEAQLRYGTTESRLKLLDNAFNRLKITVGNQLNPALNGLIDAGIGVLDWVDGFIAENEWLVPVLTGVSVALGVLSVAMVFLSTTVQAKVIPAIVAMGKALMANPVMLVIAGVAALTTALIALGASLLQADEESQRLADSTKALADEMNNSAEAYEKTEVAVAAQAKTTDALIGRLEELANKTNRSTAEQLLLEGTVAELAELYPEINSLLSDNTTELVKNIPEIKNRTEALKAQQDVEMGRDRIIELETEQAKATEQLAVNEAKRQKILDGLTDDQKKHIDGLKGADQATLAYHTAAILLDEGLSEAAASLQALGEADIALRGELQDTTEELGIRNEWFNTNAETLDRYGISLEAYNEATAGMTEAQKEQYNQLLLLEGELNNLAAAHEEAYWAAYDNIDGQIGLFETMSAEADQSIGDLIASLDSQIAYMDTYAANIEKAMALGVDKGLVQKLSDGSQESAKILDAIVNGGEDDIARLNEKLGKVEEGKNTFSTTVEDMEKDFGKKMDAINASLDGLVKDMNKSDAAATAGAQTGDSYATGLRNKYWSVYNESYRLGRAAIDGYKKGAGQNSPSKFAIAEARTTADSYAMGFEQRTKHMEDTVAKFAVAANTSYADTMKEIQSKAAPIIYNLSGLQTAQNDSAPIRVAQKSGDVTVNVYGEGMIVRNESDIKKISQNLAIEAQRKIAAKGGVPA